MVSFEYRETKWSFVLYVGIQFLENNNTYLFGILPQHLERRIFWFFKSYLPTYIKSLVDFHSSLGHHLFY